MSQAVAVDHEGDQRPIRGVEDVQDRRTLFFQRVTMVLITVIPLVGVVVAMWQTWGSGLSAVDLGIFLGLYAVTGLGITVGYHRLFTHKSFSASTPVRVAWAIAGSLAIQGAVIDWVATHRRHHAYSDKYGDPHSPHLGDDPSWRGMLKGLVHAHLGWMFQPDGTEAQTWAPDLLEEEAIARVSRAFPWLILASFLLPALLGLAITGTLAGALSAFIWGGLVRIFLLHHVTWGINSICHFWGSRPFDSHDEARNNFVLALLAFGEGWHNAHHAFPASARHGLRWWELDLAWITIRTMAMLGLARDIKLPSESQFARRLRKAA